MSAEGGEDDDAVAIGGTNPMSSQTLPNIKDIKANAVDINTPQAGPTADLDSLLNINPISQPQTHNESNFKFITPAEEIVKTDASKAHQEKIEDYFKTPDLIPVDLPNVVATANTNTVSSNELHPTKKEQNNTSSTAALNNASLININNNEPLTVQKSIDIVRNLVEELNHKGVKAEIDEMNFSKSYQIIIKLDKTAE